MLQILQTRHIENYTGLLDRLGLLDELANVVEVEENGEIIGLGVYHFDGSDVVIDYAQYNDLILGDGIYRSILFLAQLRGINSARYEFESGGLLEDCTRLGLSDKNGRLEEIASVLGGCEHCQNAENSR